MNTPNNTADDRREFLRDKVWHESDVILPDTKENKRFEDVVHHVFGQLDFSEISRDQLYVTAYDYMVSQGYEERDIGLFLSLFESSLNVLEVVERQRVDLLGILEGELLEQKKITTPGERDEDLIKQLSVEVEVIKNGTRLRIHKLMQDYLESDLKTAEREKNPFAGPYVRLLLDKQSGNRRYTDKLKEQLAELFRTSIHAIAAMKAWKSGELNGRGSTIKDIIEESRSKLSTSSPSAKKTPKKQLKKAPNTIIYKPELEDLNTTYSFIADNEYSAIAESLEPSSFSISGNKNNLNREQKQWVYALFLLGFGDEEGKQELRQHLAEKIFKCPLKKIAAVTAYLSGKLIEKAERNNSEIWQDICAIKEQKEAIDDKRKTPEKKDDDNSGESEGGRPVDVLDNQEVDEDENQEDRVDKVSEIETSDSIEVVDRSDKKSGEHFDYDNEVKIEWRKAMQAFIDKNTTLEERSKMRVLCLPGKKCLEIPVYTELGFNPANIVGVEGGDKKACAEFEKNAKAFGIDYKIGRLEKDVLDAEKPFDVVSLDFLGQMCPRYLKIMSSVPYSEKLILCTNVMAKREDMRREYQYMNLPNVTGTDLELFPFKGNDFISSFGTSAMSAIGKIISPDSTSETRDEAMLNAVMLALSSSFPVMFEEYKIVAAESAPAILGDALDNNYTTNCSLSLAWAFPKFMFPMLFQMNPEELEKDLGSIVKRAWFRFPRLLDYEVYKYKSNKSPYLSQFVGAESCIPVLIKVEKLVRFCLGTYAKVLSEKNTSSKESNVTLFNESELDVMKNEMGTMKGEMDEMKRKMRLFSKLRETIQRGIKSPQDIKRLKFLLVAAGHKLHGKKVSTDIKKKIGKNVRKKVKTRGQKNTIGINNLSLVDIMKSMFKEYEDGTAHTGCVDERTGISIEGLEESLLGEKVDNAITITQMFGDWSASVNQEDVLSAINTIREFDSQDIYLK